MKDRQTIENCRIGPNVQLKGGYFKESVFLKESKMGSGAHVREGTILGGTIQRRPLRRPQTDDSFPLCHSGAASSISATASLRAAPARKDHSEVGSSYIHFNFSAAGDKTTPSLFGDVPRGVMLDRPPIFLGGQGGAVGPLRVGFGNVVSAGSILRKDVLNERRLIMEKPHRGGELPFAFNRYAGLSSMVEKNLHYLAGLVALEQWYRHVRQGFFHGEKQGYLLYNGALDNLRLAANERVNRLKAVAEKMPESAKDDGRDQIRNRKLEFYRSVDQVCRSLCG